MSALSILSQSLANAIPNREQDFHRADAMYSSSFRSVPKTLGELIGNLTYAECLDEGMEDFFDLPDETLVCSLCNYKGEGEGGFALYEEVKHLPVFKSKSASAAHFNI